jgi:hypothetical protein
MIKSFQVIISIQKSLKSSVINKVLVFEEHIIVLSEVKCKLCSKMFNKNFLVRGVNRLNKIEGSLKGGAIIQIYFAIYGSIIILKIAGKTNAVDLYNLVAGCMNAEVRAISIIICVTGEYRNGMGIELEQNDFI